MGAEEYLTDLEIPCEDNTAILMDNNTSPPAISTTTPHMIESDRLLFAIQLILALLFGVVAIVGALGNAIVMWIVLGHRAMRTVTNYFLLNLALADFMNCTLNFPYVVAYTLFYNIWIFGSVFCRYNNHPYFYTFLRFVYDFQKFMPDFRVRGLPGNSFRHSLWQSRNMDLKETPTESMQHFKVSVDLHNPKFLMDIYGHSSLKM